MSATIRYVLNRDLASAYFNDNMQGTNTLCNLLLKQICFEKGMFYTFLPAGLDETRVHQFKLGGVAQGLKQHFTSLVLEEASRRSGKLIFDDVASDFTEFNQDPLFREHGMHYLNEIYYILPIEELSRQEVEKCMRASQAIWHSLGFITESSFVFEQCGEFDEAIMMDICKEATWIALGAYDAEGYIFWEASSKD